MKRKLICVFLLLILAVAFIAPGVSLAQVEKTSLDLRLLPGYYYSDIAPGEMRTLYLQVVNIGETAVTGITLRADKPEGWSVIIKPDTIVNIGAGNSYPVDINVIPPDRARKGEYTLVIIAEATETRAVTSTILRIDSGASFWLWIGLGITVLVVAGFIYVYRRFGRN